MSTASLPNRSAMVTGVLVPLPHDVDRDQAFAVDIVYAQTDGALASHWSKTLNLTRRAPTCRTPTLNGSSSCRRLPAFQFRRQHEHCPGDNVWIVRRWEKFLAFYGESARSRRGDTVYRLSGVLGHRARDFRGPARLERCYHSAGGRRDSGCPRVHVAAGVVRRQTQGTSDQFGQQSQTNRHRHPALCRR